MIQQNFLCPTIRAMVLCIVCKEEGKSSPYRCPQCRSPYCSVVCYKKHKAECSTVPEPAKPTTISLAEEAETSGSLYSTVLQNSRIQGLLKSEGVSKYLRLVADILHDPKLSGEHTEEGRRIVALKKLRELRKGGREENEAIEELATTVIKLVDHENEDHTGKREPPSQPES